MPLYEYAPKLADGEKGNACCYFDTLQSFSEPHLMVCPQCGHAIVRVMSSFSFGTGGAPSGSASNSPSAASDSGASRAARLAMKHNCGPGCRH